MIKVGVLFALCVAAASAACIEEEPPMMSPMADMLPGSHENFGRFEAYSKEFYKVIQSDAAIEKLVDGFWWSEGPAWDASRNRLYFSDVPQNKAFVWSEKGGLQTFLNPSSGIKGTPANTGKNDGTNGLLMLPNGKLLLANHGARSLQLLDIETKKRKEVVKSYKGKALNSPNDMVMARNGYLYFTDPPYGLKDDIKSTLKELKFSGVYRLSPSGKMKVITKKLRFPNGIGLSPDEKYLYVSNSDKEKPILMMYTKNDDGNYKNGKKIYDFAAQMAAGYPGLPDGMAVASSGHIFQTGPGGVWVFNPKGEAIGRILLGKSPKGQETANCAFGGDGKVLYITSRESLVRVRTLVGV